MSDITRREALQRLAAAFAAAGVIDQLAAGEAHALRRPADGRSGRTRRRRCRRTQFQALERLTDLIIPVDDGKPGAVQAGVPRPGSIRCWPSTPT